MISTILLCSCWDQIEIEERAFIYGMAIDVAEDNSEEIQLTEQLIIPENISTMSAGGGGGEGKAYRNIKDEGKTVYSIDRKITENTSRFTDSNHLQIVLFSEEIMKQPTLFKEYLDIFFRGKRMRRGIKVAVTNGKAEKFLTVEPEHEKIPSEYINGILENKGKLEIVDLIRIGDIQEKILEKRSFPIPYLIKKDSKKIEYAGMAIYNGQKERMVGKLEGEEAEGLSYIRSLKHTGRIDVKVNNEETTVEILKIKSKFSLDDREKNILKFTLKINIIASIAEQVGTENMESFKVLKEFEDATSKKAEEIVKKTIDTLQKDLQTDGMGLWLYLNRYKPKLWKEVKNDWDVGENYFSKSEINVVVNVKVEEPGDINRSS